MSVLLATLKPVDGTWSDGSDATFSSDQSATIRTPTGGVSTDNSDPIPTGAIEDGPGSGEIEHLVFRARVRLDNPFTGSEAIPGITSQRIKWTADVPATQTTEAAPLSSFPQNAWGWVETAPRTLAPDGAPWTWAKVASLRSIDVSCTWEVDFQPFGPSTGRIALSEAEVLIYGMPAPVEELREPFSPYFKHEVFWRTGVHLAAVFLVLTLALLIHN